jgi:structural maintenance of chromosome 4
MKPKALNPNDIGLLEYLEEIIGSQVYVEKIEELAKILEEANERRIEATNRSKASG